MSGYKSRKMNPLTKLAVGTGLGTVLFGTGYLTSTVQGALNAEQDKADLKQRIQIEKEQYATHEMLAPFAPLGDDKVKMIIKAAQLSGIPIPPVVADAPDTLNATLANTEEASQGVTQETNAVIDKLIEDSERGSFVGSLISKPSSSSRQR